MRLTIGVMILVAGCVLLLGCATPSGCVSIGMTTVEVEKACGAPSSKAYREGYGAKTESWFYQPILPVLLYVHFENGKVNYFSHR